MTTAINLLTSVPIPSTPLGARQAMDQRNTAFLDYYDTLPPYHALRGTVQYGEPESNASLLFRYRFIAAQEAFQARRPLIRDEINLSMEQRFHILTVRSSTDMRRVAQTEDYISKLRSDLLNDKPELKVMHQAKDTPENWLVRLTKQRDEMYETFALAALGPGDHIGERDNLIRIQGELNQLRQSMKPVPSYSEMVDQFMSHFVQSGAITKLMRHSMEAIESAGVNERSEAQGAIALSNPVADGVCKSLGIQPMSPSALILYLHQQLVEASSKPVMVVVDMAEDGGISAVRATGPVQIQFLDIDTAHLEDDDVAGLPCIDGMATLVTSISNHQVAPDAQVVCTPEEEAAAVHRIFAEIATGISMGEILAEQDAQKATRPAP